MPNKWIKTRGINGEYGYLNPSTNQFRTTLPNSEEEKRQQQIKNNKLVLKQQSANKAKFKRFDAKRRNHSDETIKKQIKTPIMTVDTKGNFRNNYVKQLAPGEDSTGGSDPVGSFIVANVAVNPLFKAVGRATQYGLAKAGNNWARAKILSKELDSSPIISSTLRPKPIIRTKVGDIEIDNPELYYRQGSKEMADDFLKTGIVNTDGAYSNPMFAQGHLWYGIPKSFTKREGIKTGRLNLSKRNEDVPKTHLLVSNPSTPMVGANQKSGISNNTIHVTKPYPISDKDKFLYKKYLGDDFVNQYQEAYYNGDLDKGYATEVFYFGNSRRIPATKGGANKSNTQLYEYDPKYGYKLIQKQPRTYNLNNQKIQQSIGDPIQIRKDNLLASMQDNPDQYKGRILNKVTDFTKQRKEVGKSLESSRDFIQSKAVKDSKETNQKIADRLGLPRQAEYDLQHKPVIYHHTFGQKNYNYKGASPNNVGGYYDRTKKTINLRENYSNLQAAKTIPFHENLHAQGYGPSSVNEWKIQYLIDKDKVMNMSKNSKDYFLSSEELPVHTATLGKSWGVKPGQPYPGDKAFDEMLYNNGIEGAPYYLKYNTPKDKRRFWRTLNGTMFGLSPITINKIMQSNN